MKWFNGCFVLKPSGRNREIVCICLFWLINLLLPCAISIGETIWIVYQNLYTFLSWLKISPNLHAFKDSYLKSWICLTNANVRFVWILSKYFKCPPLNSVFTKYIPSNPTYLPASFFGTPRVFIASSRFISSCFELARIVFGFAGRTLPPLESKGIIKRAGRKCRNLGIRFLESEGSQRSQRRQIYTVLSRLNSNGINWQRCKKRQTPQVFSPPCFHSW